VKVPRQAGPKSQADSTLQETPRLFESFETLTVKVWLPISGIVAVEGEMATMTPGVIFKKTLTLLAEGLETAKPGKVAALKLSTASHPGSVARLNCCGAWKVPSPLPKNTQAADD
jgi:hypothetical protein